MLLCFSGFWSKILAQFSSVKRTGHGRDLPHDGTQALRLLPQFCIQHVVFLCAGHEHALDECAIFAGEAIGVRMAWIGPMAQQAGTCTGASPEQATIIEPSLVVEQERPARRIGVVAHSRMPGSRIGAPEDCASAVVFLCSPAAGYITGEIVTIDGGLTFVQIGRP